MYRFAGELSCCYVGPSTLQLCRRRLTTSHDSSLSWECSKSDQTRQLMHRCSPGSIHPPLVASAKRYLHTMTHKSWFLPVTFTNDSALFRLIQIVLDLDSHDDAEGMMCGLDDGIYRAEVIEPPQVNTEQYRHSASRKQSSTETGRHGGKTVFQHTSMEA